MRTRSSRSGVDRPRLALVNNSRETFTPTVSGAIATCLWELVSTDSGRQAERIVLTRSAPAAPYTYPSIELVDPRAPLLRGRAERGVRRITGWAHVEQRGYANATLRRLLQLRPDAVICNNDPELAAFLSGRLPDVRVVHWFHNLELATDTWRRRYAASRVHSVAVSDYLSRAVEQVYRLAPGSVTTARNGVDGERFHPAASDAPRTVALLGRVAVEKGTDTFVSALSLLASRGTSFEVLIIGDTNWGFSDGGPFARRVAGMVQELESRGVVVRRTGHLGRDDVPDALRSASIQVLSSRWDEPCALTVLEGMASGLALVATATGGTPELVGKAGVLVPRESPQDMADAIELLLRDRELRTRLASEARTRAESFTWARTLAVLEAVALDVR